MDCFDFFLSFRKLLLIRNHEVPYPRMKQHGQGGSWIQITRSRSS